MEPKKKVAHRGGKWSVETYGENALAIQSTEQDYDGMNKSILIIEHYDGSREHNEANAERIVRAVNSHELLLDALKKTREMISIKNGKATMTTSPEFVKEIIEAAIEAATK